MSKSDQSTLEIERLRLEHVDSLLSLLLTLESEGTDVWFRPHPFTTEHLKDISKSSELDVYVVMLIDGVVMGYGMLRGWKEGYAVPSLGVALHHDCRAMGLGFMMMNFLHCVARLRGSKSVRLRVSHDNVRAISMYRRCGYTFEKPEDEISDGLIVGARTLTQ